jgi:hypothetical protein
VWILYKLSVAVSSPINNLAPAVRQETTLLLEKLCVDSIGHVLLFLPLISNLAPAM